MVNSICKSKYKVEDEIAKIKQVKVEVKMNKINQGRLRGQPPYFHISSPEQPR